MSRAISIALCTTSALAIWTAQANAQTARSPSAEPAPAQPNVLSEVMVTAEKRESAVNKVPMSISAVSGAKLQAAGITSVGDLVKVVPGFQYTLSYYSTPIYTLRGIGFNDNALSARPAVAIYVDEAPLPFSVMTEGASLDLERVEVLKGPQGILFGQNSTAGAINYIAAKPTDTLHYGGSVTVGRFGWGDVQAFVSGPLTDTLTVRIAAEQQFGGDWQSSYTRDDTIGARDNTIGRVILDWRPTSKVHIALNANAWRDHSDPQMPQLLSVTPQNAGLLPAGLVHYPLPPKNDALAADWDPGYNYHRDAKFYQFALHGDVELSPNATLTSITSYAHLDDLKPRLDMDATSYSNQAFFISGKQYSVSQELRLAGDIDSRFRYIVGASYEHDQANEDDTFSIPVNSANPTFEPFGLGSFTGLGFYTHAKYDTTGVFANGDYKLTDTITAHAGVRYTDFRGSAQSCTYDNESPEVFGPGLNIIYDAIRGAEGLPPVVIPPGGCANADAALVPGVAENRLKESNWSFRGGLDWRPTNGTLVYANVSRGFKAGSFPTLPANSSAQFAPATQEQLTAYETGFKLSLAQRTVQINGAVFYYDYDNKQISGRVLTTPNIFGPLETLVNVPKSHVTGAEAQLDWLPVRGLTLSAGATWIDSEIDGDFVNYDAFGRLQNMNGEPFPDTPKWQGVIDAQYERSLSEGLRGFVGGSVRAQSGSTSSLGVLDSLNRQLYLGGYGLLDLRAGIESVSGHWRISLFGRNVTDTYYRVNAVHSSDTNYDFAGQPATYGMTISFRY